MIVVTGAMTASAEDFPTLLAEAVAHTCRSRTEPGCISHAVSIDAENPLRLMFIEEWEDREKLDIHLAQDGTRHFVSVIARLAREQTRMKILPIVPRG
jgi:quinol monooxygenase YgiN